MWTPPLHRPDVWIPYFALHTSFTAFNVADVIPCRVPLAVLTVRVLACIFALRGAVHADDIVNHAAAQQTLVHTL